MEEDEDAGHFRSGVSATASRPDLVDLSILLNMVELARAISILMGCKGDPVFEH
jgi:hypothetical protein